VKKREKKREWQDYNQLTYDKHQRIGVTLKGHNNLEIHLKAANGYFH